MGRVCEKHNEFYETECRWCEPNVLVDFATAAILPANAGWYSGYDLLPVGCKHERRSINRDACEDCGMSGLEMLQRASARHIPIE